jgi:hypothetical protein
LFFLCFLHFFFLSFSFPASAASSEARASAATFTYYQVALVIDSGNAGKPSQSHKQYRTEGANRTRGIYQSCTNLHGLPHEESRRKGEKEGSGFFSLHVSPLGLFPPLKSLWLARVGEGRARGGEALVELKKSSAGIAGM